MADQPKRIFIRPPDDWEGMTPEDQYAWSLALVEHLVDDRARRSIARHVESDASSPDLTASANN